MTRLYHHVGPDPIRARSAAQPAGTPIPSTADLEQWVNASRPKPDGSGRIATTFVVDEAGVLRVADRGSEHVACAGGGPVRAAGELFFMRDGGSWRVESVSNQSTGYCPEPECWPAVAQALDAIPLPHPGGWTEAFVFRRCPGCGQRNLVKDGWFTCGVCGAELPQDWNFA